MKKKYIKPEVKFHGTVESLTQWVGGGCGEFLGGAQGTNWAIACRINGPADFGS